LRRCDLTSFAHRTRFQKTLEKLKLGTERAFFWQQLAAPKARVTRIPCLIDQVESLETEAVITMCINALESDPFESEVIIRTFATIKACERVLERRGGYHLLEEKLKEIEEKKTGQHKVNMT